MLKCYDCSEENKVNEAVGICIVCGKGLCHGTCQAGRIANERRISAAPSDAKERSSQNDVSGVH